jgi:hypothetical protein
MAEASTKRRVAQEAASGASGANQGASSGGASGGGVEDAAAVTGEAPKLLICEQAQKVLGKYSMGIQRVLLGQMGVSLLNRAISGRHVHRLGWRIISFEAFVLWRYKHGWAHEPNPDDPLEVARHTNAVARATALLTEVPMVALKGSFAKTHLLSFLQCLKAGNVFWDDNKQLMVPPAAAATLHEHIEHGMFYEIFQYAAVRDDRAAMLALCQADNLDSAFALGKRR